MFPYHEIGVCFSYTNIILITLCIFFLTKETPQEKCKRILFYPCLLFAILSGIITYLYLAELFIAYYSGGKYELEAFKLRITGPYALYYFASLLGVALPLLLLLPSFRRTTLCILIIVVIAFALRLAEYLPMIMSHY